MRNDIELLDAAERERAAHDLATTLLVEAAAGTGKTTLLVSRILTILRETTTPIARIAAITFTEKAAGELKVRIRQSIENELVQNRDNAEGHLARALNELDRMPVGTIHSFCRDLLRDHAIPATLDPEFRVLDNGLARTLQSDTWITWLRAELEHHPRPLSDFLDTGIFSTYSSGLHFATSIATLLIQQRARLEQLHVPALSAAACREELQDYVRALSEQCALANECRSPDDTFAAQIAIVQQWLAQEPDDAVRVVRWLLAAPKMHGGRKGRTELWPRKETLIALREFFLFESSDYRQGCERVLGVYISHVCAPLVDWLKRVVPALDAAKEQLGSLDFDDLLIYTRNLLRDHLPVREQVKQRYDYLLVDEFQDTDPLQTEIVFYCAERTGQGAASWQDVNLEHGKLFIVGDPKQSIYRFRRADIALYQLARDKIAECGDLLTIRVNFRSHPAILQEVNHLFSALMENDSAPPAIDYVPLASPPETREWVMPPLTFLTPFPDTDPRGLSVAEASALEAEMIASEIARTVARGDVAYRDCAILYERRTRLAELQSALRARQIPFETYGGREYGRRQEILWLRSLLEAAFNPYDEQAVVGALRLPLLGVSDSDLAVHRAQAPDFNYLTTASSIASITAGFERLTKFHILASTATPAELLDQIFAQTPLLALAALLPGGERRTANLLHARELAALTAQQGSGSLADYIRALRDIEQTPNEFDDPVVAESDDNVVSLLTCHKAKGLEFPVVFLYRLGQVKSFKARHILSGAHGEIELLLSPAARTQGLNRAYQTEFAEQKQESMRLLYVALTRAKSALYIPTIFERGPDSEGGWALADFLQKVYPLDATGKPTLVNSGFRLIACPLTPAAIPNEYAPLIAAEPHDARDLSERERWRRRLQLAQQALNAILAVPERVRETSPTAPLADAETALLLGSAVHRLLEKVDFAQPVPRDRLLTMLAQSGELSTDEQARAAELVSNAFAATDFMHLCRSADRHWREVPFACAIDGSIQEGIIDLLLQVRGELLIIDYKTDVVSSADMAGRVERYRPQLAMYAAAMRTVFPQTTVVCRLFFLHTGQLLPVDV